jgi:hypothetical protein
MRARARHVHTRAGAAQPSDAVRRDPLRGAGPQIPATPAALVVKKLLALPGYAPIAARGAQACVDLFTMHEFMHELSDYAISYSTQTLIAADGQQASRKNATC